MPDLAKRLTGGKPRWPSVATTKGALGQADAAYTLDTLTLPSDTPGNVWFRTTALAFFPDGRMVVCTHGGDVWIVSGIDAGLAKLQWRRFAAGLYEPFGLQVIDNKIYVTCKDRLTRLHDMNNNGEADFYESFSADTDVSTFFTHITSTCNAIRKAISTTSRPVNTPRTPYPVRSSRFQPTAKNALSTAPASARRMAWASCPTTG